MSERPILFSAPMVRAILAGRKTQTRRIVKGKAFDWLNDPAVANDSVLIPEHRFCPYGFPGDTLWVRESFQRVFNIGDGWWSCLLPTETAAHKYPANLYRWLYRATDDNNKPEEPQFPWRPSIHMPRTASRIQLRVTAVRCERLQEISYEDALAEGCADFAGFIAASEAADGVSRNETAEQCARRLRWPQRWYHKLWDEINAKRAPWASNPWVWVVEFDRMTAPPGVGRPNP